jgi:hypothetical protein
VRQNLQPVWLTLGQVLYEPGTKLGYVYFPTTAVVSILSVMIDGHSAEIAMTGHEGMVGAALLLGGG